MVTEMTRVSRLRRTWIFALVMGVASGASFAMVPAVISVPGVTLAINMIVWALFASAVHHDLTLERLRLDASEAVHRERRQN